MYCVLIEESIANCSQSKEFFASPVDEKAACRITPNVRSRYQLK